MAQSIEYRYDFTEGEIKQLEHEITNSLTEIMELEDSKRKYDAAKNAEIKEIRDPMYEKLVTKNLGFERRHAQAHRIANHDKNRVEFYDVNDTEHEDMLMTEPLTDQDMQLTTDDQPQATEPEDELVECLNERCGELFELNDVDSDDENWVCPSCDTINPLPAPPDSQPDPETPDEVEPEIEPEPAEVPEMDVSTSEPIEDTDEAEDKPKEQPNIRVPLEYGNIDDIADLEDMPITGMSEVDRLGLARAEKEGNMEEYHKIMTRLRGSRKEEKPVQEKLTQTIHDADGNVEKVKGYSVVDSEELPALDREEEIKRIGLPENTDSIPPDIL